MLSIKRKDFLYYGMDLEDKNLYKEINNSQSNIFQFSGATAAGMVKRAIPLNFDDLISINCLSRPGSSFQFDDFVKNDLTPSICSSEGESKILFRADSLNIW